MQAGIYVQVTQSTPNIYIYLSYKYQLYPINPNTHRTEISVIRGTNPVILTKGDFNTRRYNQLQACYWYNMFLKIYRLL